MFHVALNVMLSQTALWLQVMLCFYLTICQYCLTLRASEVCACVCMTACVCVLMPESALMPPPQPPSLLIQVREPDQFAFCVTVEMRAQVGCLSILHTLPPHT